jgi:hypothetical protein
MGHPHRTQQQNQMDEAEDDEGEGALVVTGCRRRSAR